MNNALVDYTIHLADNALILGHRNSEWCGHGPVVEQDIAITNISLDLIGQARNFYQYAASLIGNGCTEDTLAYHRNADEFKNSILLELPKGDWAQTILRQFYFSNYQSLLYAVLQTSKNEPMAAIAAKSAKEVAYHLRWSSEWVIRLGDGTEESNQRMTQAIHHWQPYIKELFETAPYDDLFCNPVSLQEKWLHQTAEVLEQATLSFPGFSETTSIGKLGQHTEHLSSLLAEMQLLPRTYPDAVW